MGRIRLYGLVGWLRSLFIDDEELALRELTQGVENMERGLTARRDAVTTQMALASQLREKLAQGAADFERYRIAAERLLRDGRRELALRAAEHVAAEKARMDQLATQYEDQRAKADRAIENYRAAETRVRERRQQLPELEHQQRINQLIAQSNRVLSSYDVTSSAATFDRIAERIRLQAQKLDAADLLEGAESAVADLQIEETLRRQDAEAVLAEIEAQVQASPGGMRPIPLDQPVERARALLSAPAFKALTSGVRTQEIRERLPSAPEQETVEERRQPTDRAE